MGQIIIEMECASTKQGRPYTYNGKTQRQHDIAFDIPYKDGNIFSQLSGGTALNLLTVNDDAVADIAPGKKYRVTIEEI
jgi:hypothetical protein